MDDATRVLVIDDDAGVRLILRKNLQHAGFDVETAEGAQQGLALTRDWSPDVIVLDLMMPHIDGFEVLSHLARDGRTVVPVIVLTAMTAPDVKERCIRAGASLVMTKPFEPHTLAIEIERILAQTRSAALGPSS